MKMRRIISAVTALALTATLCTALSGCGKQKAKYTVGICQLVQHEALDAATKGFQDVLKEKLGDDVEFDYQNAANESTNCATIANQFVSKKVDLIMANASPALMAAAQATTDIPILGTSITHYAAALQIKDWNGKTGINVSGTADLAPLKDQAAMIKELFPDAKTVGILYCSGEPNSQYQATEITKYLKELNIETKSFTFADSNDLAAVTTTACAQSDVLYAPTDNTVASNKAIINNIAEPAKKPIVTGEAGICRGCGIATLSIDYYELGKMTGEMAYEVLVNGKNPGDMEIQYTSNLTKQYHKTRSEKIGVKIPEGYTAMSEK